MASSKLIESCWSSNICEVCGKEVEIINNDVEFSRELHYQSHKNLSNLNEEINNLSIKVNKLKLHSTKDTKQYLCTKCNEYFDIFNNDMSLSLQLHSESHNHQEFKCDLISKQTFSCEEISKVDKMFDTFSIGLKCHRDFITEFKKDGAFCKVCNFKIGEFFYIYEHLKTKCHEDNIISVLKQKLPHNLHDAMDYVYFYEANLCCNLCHCKINLCSKNLYETIVNVIAHNSCEMHMKYKIKNTSKEVNNEAHTILLNLADLDSLINQHKNYVDYRMIPQFKCKLCNKNMDYVKNRKELLHNFKTHLNSFLHERLYNAISLIKEFELAHITFNVKHNFEPTVDGVYCSACNSLVKGNAEHLLLHLKKKNCTNFPNFDSKKNFTNLPEFDSKKNCTNLPGFYSKKNCTNLPDFDSKKNCTHLPDFYSKKNCTNLPDFDSKKNFTNLPGFYSKKNCTNLPDFDSKKNCTNLPDLDSKKNCTNLPDFYLKKNCTNLPDFDSKKNCTNLPEFVKEFDSEINRIRNKPSGLLVNNIQSTAKVQNISSKTSGQTLVTFSPFKELLKTLPEHMKPLVSHYNKEDQSKKHTITSELKSILNVLPKELESSCIMNNDQGDTICNTCVCKIPLSAYNLKAHLLGTRHEINQNKILRSLIKRIPQDFVEQLENLKKLQSKLSAQPEQTLQEKESFTDVISPVNGYLKDLLKDIPKQFDTSCLKIGGTIAQVICKVCDCTMSINSYNVQSHLSGVRHKSNKKLMMTLLEKIPQNVQVYISYVNI